MTLKWQVEVLHQGQAGDREWSSKGSFRSEEMAVGFASALVEYPGSSAWKVVRVVCGQMQAWRAETRWARSPGALVEAEVNRLLSENKRLESAYEELYQSYVHRVHRSG